MTGQAFRRPLPGRRHPRLRRHVGGPPGPRPAAGPGRRDQGAARRPGRDPSFQARFRREAQNAASLNHPAIVAVYDTGETQGETGPVPYIVMEYVDGETLRDLLRREGPLVPKRAMEIVADICAALDFSHRHGIVHRDIKPANVMLTRGRRGQGDGLRHRPGGRRRPGHDDRHRRRHRHRPVPLARAGPRRGGRRPLRRLRHRLRAVRAAHRAPPFTGDSPVAVAYQHVREEPKPPSTVKPGLPHEMDAIVLKALNKNPLNRYQTAAEMRADLVRALSGQVVQAPKVMTDEERTADHRRDAVAGRRRPASRRHPRLPAPRPAMRGRLGRDPRRPAGPSGSGASSVSE